jgi:hypothetical protein
LNFSPDKAKAFMFYWSKVKSRIQIESLKDLLRDIESKVLENFAKGLGQKINLMSSCDAPQPRGVKNRKIKEVIMRTLGQNEGHDYFFDANKKLIICGDNSHILFVPINRKFEVFLKILNDLITTYKNFPKINEMIRESTYNCFQVYIDSLSNGSMFELEQLLQLLNQIRALDQAYKNMILIQIFTNHERNNDIFEQMKTFKSFCEEKFIKFLESKLNVDATLYISKYSSSFSDFMMVKSPSDEILIFFKSVTNLFRIFDESMMENMKEQCLMKLTIIKEKIILKELESLKKGRRIQPFIVKNEIAFLNKEFENLSKAARANSQSDD